MAIDVSKLANRLKQFDNETKQSEASKYLWKPSEGIQTVRLVPYKYSPEVPFIELKFYYKLGGKNYLAPCTFGKPDPIAEFVDTLRSSGVQAQRELARKLEAKSRTYAPIIVRGEEEQGVKYWGFGVTVYKQLLKLITNPKWGDITSMSEGNDIDIEFKKISDKKGADGQSFPETNITPDPRKSPVVEPARTDLLKLIKEQYDVSTIWPLPSYDELKNALELYINPDADQSSGDSSPDETESVAPKAASVTPTLPKTSSPAGKPATVDADQAFDKFFNT
jgi:hypothetical protein